jgi:hypothetical protein
MGDFFEKKKLLLLLLKKGSSQFGLAGKLPGPRYGIAKPLFYPLGSRTGEAGVRCRCVRHSSACP